MKSKPKIGVHKFTSCDGCQLAFLNLGEDLGTLFSLTDIVHFPEAGPIDPDAEVDIAFIEGSITTPDEVLRIKDIRHKTKFLVTIGACATSGGIQALRNIHQTQEWIKDIYAKPEFIDSLETSSPISDHINVDFQLWGCPIDSRQLVSTVHSLLVGVKPTQESEKLCLECKRQQNVCVMITKGEPCMGPVTRTGCGALCPHFERDCYGCFGPAENTNTDSLSACFEGIGLVKKEIDHRYQFINSNASAFQKATAKVEDTGVKG
jgi:coenzyme F420-reducing hydrogenase gamma subunit